MAFINWQPSIARSIRGNSSYGFLNQVFNADIDRLKIETSIVNKSRQAKIFDSILTVIYQENIDDDIFYIPVGDAKPLLRIVENIKPFPFKLSLQNLNESPLRLTLQKPKAIRVKYPLNTSSMSSQSNPSTPSDPAVLAALTSIIANTANTQNAVTAGDENLIAYTSTQIEVTLPLPIFTVVGNTYRIHAADSRCRELVISNNNTAGKLKLAIIAPADGIPYTSVSNLLGNPIDAGGNFIISDPMCRGDVYAVGSLPNMKVSIAKSAKV